MLTVAFYRGRGRLGDWLVRLFTLSRYSHCELVFSDGRWYSASARDGSVRFKSIAPRKGRWDFIAVMPPVDHGEEAELSIIARRWLGARYGYWDVLRFLLPVPLWRQRRREWFCSEIVLAMLQKIGRYMGPVPSRTSPGRLYGVMVRGG